MPEERQAELEQVLAKYLSEEEKGDIMRTIAQKYIEEGEVRGIQIGETKGEARLVKTIRDNGSSIEEIAKMTRLSVAKIRELLKMST